MFSKWGQCVFHLWILCTVSWLLLFERCVGPPCIIYDDKVLLHVLLSTTLNHFSKVSFASRPADTYIGLISKEQLCRVLVNISSLSIAVWWFKIAWPKWLHSIIDLTVCGNMHLLKFSVLDWIAHFLVPTVSKDTLLCALNKQRLFAVELPEFMGRRWWRMRAKREMIYLMNAEWDECGRTVISQFPAGERWKGHGIADCHLHTVHPNLCCPSLPANALLIFSLS